MEEEEEKEEKEDWRRRRSSKIALVVTKERRLSKVSLTQRNCFQEVAMDAVYLQEISIRKRSHQKAKLLPLPERYLKDRYYKTGSIREKKRLGQR